MIKRIFLEKKKNYKEYPFTKYVDIFMFSWYLMGIVFSKLNMFALTVIFIGFNFQEYISPRINKKNYFILILILGSVFQILL